MEEPDTIAAVATAIGEASISVIRVSGSQSRSIVERIFRGGGSLAKAPSHTVWHGWIVRMDSGQHIDEVLVTVMKAPRSYTTEDVVEIGCHGGTQSVQAILLELLRAGARLAEPGEFTKRAFLGGRIDLAQAEGVMELIGAQTVAGKDAALRQVEGSLTGLIKKLRQNIIQLMAHIEVTIDYPEHDVEEATTLLVKDGATQLLRELRDLIVTAANGRVLKTGIRTVIVGRPNVGKSSLLNQLARAERAIVTDIPGTTRDVVEEGVQIAGIPLRILDTAGIRDTTDVVERLGVMRSRQAIKDADLLLIMIDASRSLAKQDEELLALVASLPAIVVLNKMDLPARITLEDLSQHVAVERIVPYSVFRPELLQDLEQAIVRVVFGGELQVRDATFIANARHLSLLEQANACLDQVLESIAMGVTLDLVAVDLRQAWVTLGEIIGETPREDLLDQIFSQFCLGK